MLRFNMMSFRAEPRPIRFPFDERKATAAASLLLTLAGGRMEYTRLIKLLYYVDRESLERLGRPITGDRYVAMKHGPVLSQIYDLIKVGFATPPAGPWADHIETTGRYDVQVRGKPDLGPLSDLEIESIESTFKRYRNFDKWDLRDESHTLGEWEHPGESAREILIEEILQVLGKSEAEIEEVRQAANEAAHFHSIFGR